MKEFVQCPHLPQKAVCCAAISSKAPYTAEVLAKLGIEPLLVFPSPHLAQPVSSHADMRLHHVGGEDIVVEKGDHVLRNALHACSMKVHYSEKGLLPDYPHDIGLNCFPIQQMLVGNTVYIDPFIKYSYQQKGFDFIHIKQGYSKCSTALVSKNAIITSDTGIHHILTQRSIDCLLIPPGHIQLPGYNYGFIGGCCFLAAPDLLCFWGNLSIYPYETEIRKFCKKHAVHAISLSPEPLMDIGSVIPLICQ